MRCRLAVCICLVFLARMQLGSCIYHPRMHLGDRIARDAAAGSGHRGAHQQMQHNPLERYRARNLRRYSVQDGNPVTLTVNATDAAPQRAVGGSVLEAPALPRHRCSASTFFERRLPRTI